MSKQIATIAIAAVAVLAAGIGGYALFVGAEPLPDAQHDASSRDEPIWVQNMWPFPIDQWGDGWAYQCKAADCGVDVSLYLRPKIGFCNCQTGVADDEELDRVSDTDLVGGDRSALGPGHPITVHWMKGRSRTYAVVGTPATSGSAAKSATAKPVLSLGFNNRCDVIVATVVAGKTPAAAEQAVLEFLNGEVMRNWAEVVLGL